MIQYTRECPTSCYAFSYKPANILKYRIPTRTCHEQNASAPRFPPPPTSQRSTVRQTFTRQHPPDPQGLNRSLKSRKSFSSSPSPSSSSSSSSSCSSRPMSPHRMSQLFSCHCAPSFFPRLRRPTPLHTMHASLNGGGRWVQKSYAPGNGAGRATKHEAAADDRGDAGCAHLRLRPEWQGSRCQQLLTCTVPSRGAKAHAT